MLFIRCFREFFKIMYTLVWCTPIHTYKLCRCFFANVHKCVWMRPGIDNILEICMKNIYRTCKKMSAVGRSMCECVCGRTLHHAFFPPHTADTDATSLKRLSKSYIIINAFLPQPLFHFKSSTYSFHVSLYTGQVSFFILIYYVNVYHKLSLPVCLPGTAVVIIIPL